MKVAFIGLGHMGSGMAARQAAAGRAVAAFDLSAVAMEKAVQSGCTPARSAAEAVRDADAVITMLPAGAHVRSVYQDEVLPHAAPHALLIDCSTTDVATAQDMGALAREAGLRFADAPVSGGAAAAEAGGLTFMVGCAQDDLAAVEHAVAPMAKAVLRAGETGAGQAAKICNNMVLGASMIAVCEAFALAEKLGLDARAFFDIAAQSSAQCWSLTSYAPWPGLVAAAPSNRNYEGGFSAALMLKDLKLAQEAAARHGAAAPLGAAAESLYALFAAQGGGGRDFSAIIEMLRGETGNMKP